MWLRHKKTGEIRDVQLGNHNDPSDGIIVVYSKNGEPREPHEQYSSLAELSEEWEDYEEVKVYWYINAMGLVFSCSDLSEECIKELKQIGNYFETKEEAKRAAEKLKAFANLRKKGFRFDGWEDLQAKMDLDDLLRFNKDVIDADNVIGFRMNDYHNCIKDLDLLFGGEDE